MPAPNALQLGKLAAAFSIAFILTLVAALFAIHSTNEKALASLEKLGEMKEAVTSSRNAQVRFKTQVQEWKNTLLRGQTKADYDKYHDAFIRDSGEVESLLADLAKQMTELGLDPAPANLVLQMHKDLMPKYDTALALYKPGVPQSLPATDAAVRGIDRPVNDALDALAVTLENDSDQMLSGYKAEALEHYTIVHRITVILGAVTLVLAGIFIVQSLRRATAS